jgi:putative methyltransferase (TIGR04325 family)
MTSRIKRLVRDLAPPLLVRALRRSAPPVISFEGNFADWESARAHAHGYENASILEAVKNATFSVTRGEATYERDSVLFDRVELSWPMLAGLLWAAARNAGRLSVLDFGGSLGTSYRQNKAFLGGLAEVRWGVVDQPDYVTTGREYFADDTLQFFDTIDAAAAALQPNIVTLGATLQYLQEPYEVLQALANTSANVMVIDRTSFSDLANDSLAIQHVAPPIYQASYPCWIFSKGAFEDRIPVGWKIASWFDASDGSAVTDSGVRLTFKGMILVR